MNWVPRYARSRRRAKPSLQRDGGWEIGGRPPAGRPQGPPLRSELYHHLDVAGAMHERFRPALERSAARDQAGEQGAVPRPRRCRKVRPLGARITA